MRMDRRAGLLSNKVRVPTFAELATMITNYKFTIVNNASSAGISVAVPPSAQAGQVWYSFYCVGGSMEICRIPINSDGTMGREFFGCWSPSSGVTKRYTALSSDGLSLQGTENVLGGSLVLLRFSITPKATDYMFTPNNFSTGTLHYYYGSYVANNTDLQCKTSDITAKSGVCLATYRHTPSSGTGNSVFGFVNTQTSLTMIKGFDSNGWRTTSPLRGYTSSNVSYRTPSADGSNNARVRAYTLKYLTENWSEVWV